MDSDRRIALAAAVALVAAVILYRRFLDAQLQVMHGAIDRLEEQHGRHLEEISKTVSGGRQRVDPPVSPVERTHEGPTIIPPHFVGGADAEGQMTAAQPPSLERVMEELEIEQHRERGIPYPQPVGVDHSGGHDRPINPDTPGPVGDDEGINS